MENARVHRNLTKIYKGEQVSQTRVNKLNMKHKSIFSKAVSYDPLYYVVIKVIPFAVMDIHSHHICKLHFSYNFLPYKWKFYKITSNSVVHKSCCGKLRTVTICICILYDSFIYLFKCSSYTFFFALYSYTSLFICAIKSYKREPRIICFATNIC